MTLFVFDNNINTTLASSVGSGATTITLSSATNLPASIPSGYYLVVTLNDAATRQIFEVLYATAVTGATLTVLRGQEGTTALSWSSGDFVFSGVTAGQMTNLDQNVHGIQVYNAPGTYTFTVPAPVLYVEVWGGGGGGSGNQPSTIGQCGSAGAYGFKRLTGLTVGSSVTVTVGAAGTAGPGGADTNGGAGGSSSFGSSTVAGGNGGLSGTSAAISGAAAPTGFDIAMAGGASFGCSFAGSSPVGIGGNSPRGGMGGPASNAGGFGGTWPGGGGGSGMSTVASPAGGAGAAGGVIIRW